MAGDCGGYMEELVLWSRMWLIILARPRPGIAFVPDETFES